MTKAKKCLLAVEVRDTNSTDELSKVCNWVDKEFDLLSLSSIYELRNDENKTKASDKIRLMQAKSLSVAISVETALKPHDLLDLITLKQADLNQSLPHGSIHLYLLFYDDQVSMLPNLHLPHPEWLVRKDWMLASMDVWPNYEHPVLEDPLSLTVRNKKIRPGDYFFAQGKMLLKTNMPGT